MIRGVLFDIDDTLYNSTELAYRARQNAVKAMIEAGLPVKNPEKVLKVLLEVIQELGPNYGEHYRLLLEKLGIEWDPEIIAAGVAAYHDTKFSYLKPFPDTIPVLLQLKVEGYKIGAISDGLAVKQWEKLIRLGLHHFFDTVIISETLESSKPDPKMFKAASEGMRLSSNEILMVGDSKSRDISGGKNVGMKTVWIESAKKGDTKPDFVVKSLSGLPAILEELNGKYKQ